MVWLVKTTWFLPLSHPALTRINFPRRVTPYTAMQQPWIQPINEFLMLPASLKKRLQQRFPLPPPHRVLKSLNPVLARPLHLLPFGLQKRALEKLIRESFSTALQRGKFDFLRGRWLCLEVTDVGLRWYITQTTHGPVVVNNPMRADVSIRGDLHTMVSLANQTADADTLFFQRKLKVEGDTELGLAVKNLMFGTEINGFPKFISRVLEAYMDYVSAP